MASDSPLKQRLLLSDKIALAGGFVFLLAVTGPAAAVGYAFVMAGVWWVGEEL